MDPNKWASLYAERADRAQELEVPGIKSCFEFSYHQKKFDSTLIKTLVG